MRQIVLDTETTGLAVEEGHRIIEIACVEMINRKITGSCFHHYVNPERTIEAGAQAVHGISNAFLEDKLKFIDIAEKLIDYISGAELIIHNAPFDLSFIHRELQLAGRVQPVTEVCRILDTLQLARQLHAGQRNSLDALCKRYHVDHSKRDLHGALLDAHLLAQVYLAMSGGQGSFFDLSQDQQKKTTFSEDKIFTPSHETYRLTVLNANDHEIAAHENYLQQVKKQGKCLWLDEQVDVP